MTSTTADRRLLTSINTQWRDLVRHSGQVVSGWSRRWECLAPCADLAACIVRPRGRCDEVLGALVTASREGDDVAGRAILQALLPAMVRMAERDRAAGLSDYLGQLWCRIRTYPLERRPAKIANNLELDTLKSVCRERAGGGQRATVVPIGGEDLEGIVLRRERPGEAFEPTARTVIGAAVASGLIDEYTSKVLHTVYADGLTGREAARRHHTSVDLIRWRCSRGVRTLARHATLLAEVA